MTFPLPLTPFEEYALRDGTPSHPLEFFYRLTFDGPLDRAAVAAAAGESLRRHPLLAARIEERPGRTPRFVMAGAVDSVVVVDGAAGLPPIPALDTARGPLARLLLVERPDGTADILAQFHHAACDGLGALAFLGDFCGILAATLRGDRLPADTGDPLLLRGRGRYGLDSASLLRSLPDQARGLEGVWKFLMNRPMRLAAARGEDQPAGFHRLQRSSAEFHGDDLRGLRRAATDAGVSLNELAAAALLEAICDVLPPTACGHARDKVRLSIPMNMRRPADRRMPAANIVSMVFLDRGPAEIASSALATSLHDEMQLIKRLGLGMTFLFTLGVARCLPGGIARLVGDRSTAATALFTNLGRIFSRSVEHRGGCVRVGPCRLVGVEPLAPLRRGTALAMAAVEYGGTLVFTLRTDPHALDAETTAALRDAFFHRLRHCLPADPAGPSQARAAATAGASA
ncbi:MAG: hypothetical protein WCR51_07345 [Planctomycetia bacterium]